MTCVVCGREGPGKFTKESQGWDWFTGDLPETVHFCPEHADSKQRHEAFQRSRQLQRERSEEIEAVRDRYRAALERIVSEVDAADDAADAARACRSIAVDALEPKP